MHLLVPRSRSSAKVKVKYKSYISQKMAVSGAFVFHIHILLDLEFLVIFSFLTPNTCITKHINLELINSNVTRGHTFKIKASIAERWHPHAFMLIVSDLCIRTCSCHVRD